MDEKIAVSTYVLMHLITTDFVACFAGALIRGLYDWYNARTKVKHGKNGVFTNRQYFTENGDKIAVSLVSAFALLFIIPEITIAIGDTIFGRAVVWNTGFSGLIGVLAFDIVTTIHKRGRMELRRLQKSKPNENPES